MWQSLTRIFLALPKPKHLYRNYPNIVFGFHACSQEIGDRLVHGSYGFKPSNNSYDWLGTGMYFWENSVHRAKCFAKDRGIKNPCVVGAALQLGHCLDLTDSESLSYLSSSYRSLVTISDAAGLPLPKNKRPKGTSTDFLLRDLDCAVINLLHSERKESQERNFDSVRGVFWEGSELYPGAGFKDKNHVQLCIVNPNCIKGFFWPRNGNVKYSPV